MNKSNRSSMGKRLYVGNLAANTSEAALLDAFATIGITVQSARIITHRHEGADIGCVEMRTEDDARRVIERLHRRRRIGKKMCVNEARETRVLRA